MLGILRELYENNYPVGRGLRLIYNGEYLFDDLPAALARQDAGTGGKIVIVHG